MEEPNNTRKLLYQDPQIKIYQRGSPNEHDIEAGKLYCYFGRGILKELAESDTERLRRSLEVMNPPFLFGLITSTLSLDRLGWAISKARISELEQEIENLCASEQA
ncbi:MAG: hypothetical protein AABX54_03745 [Nanoarchaeota archaeon]